MRYFDADNKLGARIGAQAEVVDGGINLRLMPDRPTLGYKEFALNKDNYVFLGSSGKIKAKVDLRADDGMGIRLYSEFGGNHICHPVCSSYVGYAER